MQITEEVGLGGKVTNPRAHMGENAQDRRKEVEKGGERGICAPIPRCHIPVLGPRKPG